MPLYFQQEEKDWLGVTKYHQFSDYFNPSHPPSTAGATIQALQARSQKLLLGGSFGQNVDLFGKIVDLFSKNNGPFC